MSHNKTIQNLRDVVEVLRMTDKIDYPEYLSIRDQLDSLEMTGYIDIVFDGEPGPEGPVLVETEDSNGNGIRLGDWVKRSDDYWVLRVPRQEITGQTSDGHHTFDELYDYRMLYNAHAAHGWLAAGIPVVKSWRHSDGEECFGGGWFIVTATLPTGQVSNHYREQYWDLFQVPDEEVAPEYDGHTPEIAANRLRSYLEGQHLPQEAV